MNDTNNTKKKSTQELLPNLPSILKAGPKKLFVISDSGEFVESLHEVQPFISLQFLRKWGYTKRFFTIEDILFEGYLYIYNSWMRSWKKRYFVLRRDIQSVCCYESKQHLKLCATIPLSSYTSVDFAKQDYYDILDIRPWGSEADDQFKVRADSYEEMKSWEIKIVEASCLNEIADDADWWTKYQDKIPEVSGITSRSIRGRIQLPGIVRAPKKYYNASADPMDLPSYLNDNSLLAEVKISDDSQEGDNHIVQSKDDETSELDDDDSDSRHGQQHFGKMRMYLEENNDSQGEKGIEHEDQEEEEEQEQEEKEEDDDEGENDIQKLLRADSPSPTQLTTPLSPTINKNDTNSVKIVLNSSYDRLSFNAREKFAKLSDAAEKEIATSKTLRKNNWKLKKSYATPKIPKVPIYAPPYHRVVLDRYNKNERFIGYQLSLKLFNICKPLDKITVSIYTSSTAESNPDNEKHWKTQSSPETVIIPKVQAGIHQEFHISFSFLHEMEKEYQLIMIVVNSAVGLQSKPIARGIFNYRDWMEQPCFISSIKVLNPSVVDISSPMFSQQLVTLRVLKLSSSSLLNAHRDITKSMGLSPYSESLYSFQTRDGQTLTFEHLYAPKFSVTVAECLIKFIQLERGLTISGLSHLSYKDLDTITYELAKVAESGQKTRTSDNNPLDRYIKSLNIGRDILSTASETINDVQSDMQDTFMIIAEQSQQVRQAVSEQQPISSHIKEIPKPQDIITYLRKCTWKKHPEWQLSSMNLNVHIMVSKAFTFRDIFPSAFGDPNKNTSPTIGESLVAIPTITLACPAAHQLGLSNGGLRNLFVDIPDRTSRLLWLYVLQSDIPSSDFIAFLEENPAEATAVFQSQKISPISLQLTSWIVDLNKRQESSHFKERKTVDMLKEISMVPRKFELSGRIDVVCSQVLAYALSHVKTVITLATVIKGEYLDILQRSLKIGFLISAESLLNTSKQELGMLDDLEIGMEWLSLVNLRLFTPTKNKCSSSGNKRVILSSSDGVTIRRDMVGRMIVDLEITSDEAETIRECSSLMEEFSSEEASDYDSDLPMRKKYLQIVRFDPNPDDVLYGENETQPDIHAVVKLYGVLFNQGINDSKTMLNLTKSRDEQRQLEINVIALDRLETYFDKYLSALNFQIMKALRSYMSSNEEILTALKPETKSTTKRQSTRRRSSLLQSLTGDKIAAASTLNSTELSDSLNVSPVIPHEIELSDSQFQLDSLCNEVIQSAVRSFEDAKLAVKNSIDDPSERHVDVLLKLSALCRKLGGTIGIVCSNGKDIAAMAATLESTRSLVEDLGANCGENTCTFLRQYGAFRMSNYVNTNDSRYAFSSAQRAALPTCYQPPTEAIGSKVT